MSKKYRSYFLFVSLSFLCSFGIDADTLFVESLDDALGSVATLRQTIINASSGDTIKFNVSGTIFLDTELGMLIVGKQLTIDGQNKIILDGTDLIAVCFSIVGAGASGSTITNITIQNFNGHAIGSVELPAVGVFITLGAEACSVINTTIKNIGAGTNLFAYGIFCTEGMTEVSYNKIENIYSKDAPTISSREVIAGIVVVKTTTEGCNNNTIHSLRSGSSIDISGDVLAIAMNSINGNCSGNAIYNLSSGAATTLSGDVFGILSDGILAESFSNNTIYNLSSGSSEDRSGRIYGIRGDSINGDISHNTFYNFFSGTATTLSGNIFGITFSLPSEATCYENTLSRFYTGTASSNSGALYGMNFEQINKMSCYDNKIHSLSTGTAGNNSGITYGIHSNNEVIGTYSGNSIFHLSTGKADNKSGDIFGMYFKKGISGNCSNNKIYALSSGDSSNGSSHIAGIFFTIMNGNCTNNLVQRLSSGTVSNSGELSMVGIHCSTHLIGDCKHNTVTDMVISNTITELGGMVLHSIADGHIVMDNVVKRIIGEQNGQIFGIKIEEGNSLTIRNNMTDSVVGNNGLAHGLILGSESSGSGSENKATSVTDSFVSFNTISNIASVSLDGFGITILGSESSSRGNDLLNNSIFSINGKAINIIGNDLPVDATVILQSVVCGAHNIVIRGILEPEPGFEESEFVVQFFISSGNIPPQTTTLLGEETVVASGGVSETGIPFLAEIKGCLPYSNTVFITATATAQLSGTGGNNNTSEVSNAIPGCNNNGLCSFLCAACS